MHLHFQGNWYVLDNFEFICSFHIVSFCKYYFYSFANRLQQITNNSSNQQMFLFMQYNIGKYYINFGLLMNMLNI